MTRRRLMPDTFWPTCPNCGSTGWRYACTDGTGWRCFCGAHQPDQLDRSDLFDVDLPEGDIA